MRLLVTRPQPDAERQAEKLAVRGHEPVIASLLDVSFVQAPALDLAGVQALIVTSRNALRAFARHPDLADALKRPLFAVGEATARAAAELGFTRVIEGPGTGEELAGLIGRELAPGKGSILHLRGETVAFDMASALTCQGFDVRRTILYRTMPVPALPPDVLALLEAGRLDGAILMSPRTATTLAELVRRHGVVTPFARVVCYCLSEAVAGALAPLAPEIRIAWRPREEEVLALIDSEAASSDRA